MSRIVHWSTLAELGDQFLLQYAHSPGSAHVATLFSVGHAAELYLKALALKASPRTSPSKYGHRVAVLLEVAHGSGVLLDYAVSEKIRDEVMRAWPLPMSKTDTPEFRSYVEHQELYWVTYYLSDVKYLGSEHQRAPEAFGVMVRARNHYWIPFFQELRAFLGWPAVGRDDALQWAGDPSAHGDAVQRFLAHFRSTTSSSTA